MSNSAVEQSCVTCARAFNMQTHKMELNVTGVQLAVVPYGTAAKLVALSDDWHTWHGHAGGEPLRANA